MVTYLDRKPGAVNFTFVNRAKGLESLAGRTLLGRAVDMKGFFFDENLPARIRFTPSLPLVGRTELGNSPTDIEVWEFAHLKEFFFVRQKLLFQAMVKYLDPAGSQVDFDALLQFRQRLVFKIVIHQERHFARGFVDFDQSACSTAPNNAVAHPA
jgi:hypothetical protein